MQTKDFFTMDTHERFDYINTLLEKYEKDSLKNVAQEIGVDYAILCR